MKFWNAIRASFIHTNTKEDEAAMLKEDFQRTSQISSDEEIAATYAYRYLLNREPESIQRVKDNKLGWQELREVFLQSQEYKMLNLKETKELFEDMPYQSLQVEGITYFYNRLDHVLPDTMRISGVNWAKADIDNFIDIADRLFYENQIGTIVSSTKTGAPRRQASFWT